MTECSYSITNFENQYTFAFAKNCSRPNKDFLQSYVFIYNRRSNSSKILGVRGSVFFIADNYLVTRIFNRFQCVNETAILLFLSLYTAPQHGPRSRTIYKTTSHRLSAPNTGVTYKIIIIILMVDIETSSKRSIPDSPISKYRARRIPYLTIT